MNIRPFDVSHSFRVINLHVHVSHIFVYTSINQAIESTLVDRSPNGSRAILAQVDCLAGASDRLAYVQCVKWT
jgi:hypothetical protein